MSKNKKHLMKELEAKSKLKFNLQNFSDGGDAGDTPPPDTKTFTQEEVDVQIAAVIGKERAKSEKQLKDIEASIPDRIKRALEEQQSLAGMSEVQKLQKELEDTRKAKEEVEQRERQTTIKNEALSILAERKVPTEFAEFLVAPTAEATLERIDDFTERYKASVRADAQALSDERLKGTTPAASQMSSDLSNNPFITGNVTEQMKLMKTNPELAAQYKDAAQKANNKN